MSHFFLIPTLKEFYKSTNICQSYSKNKSGPVFLTHSVYRIPCRRTREGRVPTAAAAAHTWMRVWSLLSILQVVITVARCVTVIVSATDVKSSRPKFLASASSSCNADLVLTKDNVVLVVYFVSHRNHIICVTFFSDRKLLLAL